MAITQVTQYNSTPTVVGDYAAQNKHIQAFINQVNNHSFILTDPTATTIPAIALGTYISSGGTLFLVDTANYTIFGSVASGNNYIKMSVSGTTLTATWIQNISAYAYNPIYGYLASGTDMILPYLVVYDGSSVYNKYRNDIIKVEGYRTAGDYIIQERDTAYKNVSTTYTIASESFKLKLSGTIRIVFEIGTATSGTSSYGRVYKNGIAVGAERTTLSATESFSEDFTIQNGDIFSVYTKSAGVNGVWLYRVAFCCNEEGVKERV